MNTPSSSARKFGDVFRVRVSPSRSNTPGMATPPPTVPLPTTATTTTATRVGVSSGVSPSRQTFLEKEEHFPPSVLAAKDAEVAKVVPTEPTVSVSRPQQDVEHRKENAFADQYTSGAVAAVAAVSSVHRAFTSSSSHTVMQKERHQSARRVVYEVSSTSSEGLKEQAQNPTIDELQSRGSTPAVHSPRASEGVVMDALPSVSAPQETPIAERVPVEDNEADGLLPSPIVVLTDFEEDRASESPSEVRKDDADENNSMSDPDESIATHVTKFVEGTQRLAEVLQHNLSSSSAHQESRTNSASKLSKGNDGHAESTRRPLRYAQNEKDNSDSDSFVGFFKKRNDTDESGASFGDNHSAPFPAESERSPDIRLVSARETTSAERQAMFRTPPAASTSTGRPDPRSDTKRGGSMDEPTPVEIPRNTYSVGSTATSTAGRIVSLPDESPFGLKPREPPRRRPTRELPPDMFIASTVATPPKSVTTQAPSAGHAADELGGDAREQGGATPTYTAMHEDVVHHSPTASERAASESTRQPVSNQTSTATSGAKATIAGSTVEGSESVKGSPTEGTGGGRTSAMKASSIGSGGSTPTPRGVVFHLPQPGAADVEGRYRYPDVVRSQNSFVIPGDTSPSILQLQVSSPASGYLQGSSVKEGSSVRPESKHRQSQPFFFTEDEKLMHEYGNYGNVRIHRSVDDEQRPSLFAPRMYSDALEKFHFGERLSGSQGHSNGNSLLDVQETSATGAQQRVGPPIADGRRRYTHAESIDVSRDIQSSTRKSVSAGVAMAAGGGPHSGNMQRRRTTQLSQESRPPHQPPLVPPLALSGHTRRDYIKTFTDNVAGEAESGSHNSSAMGLAVYPKRLFGQPPTSSSSLSSPDSNDSANQTMTAATETRVPRPSTKNVSEGPATPVQRKSGLITVLSIGKEQANKSETMEGERTVSSSSGKPESKPVKAEEKQELRQTEEAINKGAIVTESRMSAKEEDRLLQQHLDRKERETLSRCLRTWYRCMFERAVSLETTAKRTVAAKDGKTVPTQQNCQPKSMKEHHERRHRSGHGHHQHRNHHQHDSKHRTSRISRQRHRVSSRSGGGGGHKNKKSTRDAPAVLGYRSQSSTSTSTSTSSSSSSSSTLSSGRRGSTSSLGEHLLNAHERRYEDVQAVANQPTHAQGKWRGEADRGTTIAKETITSFATVVSNVDESGRNRRAFVGSRGHHRERSAEARKSGQTVLDNALQKQMGDPHSSNKIHTFEALGGREIEVGKTYVDWKIRRNRSTSAGARKKKPALSSRLDKVISRLSGDLQRRVRAVLQGGDESDTTGHHNSDSQETSSGSVDEASEMLHTARITAMMLKGNLEDLSDEDLARWFMFPRTQQLLRELREANGSHTAGLPNRIHALSSPSGYDAANLLRQMLQNRNNGGEMGEAQGDNDGPHVLPPPAEEISDQMGENEWTENVEELHGEEPDAAHKEHIAIYGAGAPYRRKTAAYAGGPGYVVESIQEPIALPTSETAGDCIPPLQALGSAEQQHVDAHSINYMNRPSGLHKIATEPHVAPIVAGQETAPKQGEPSLSPLTPIVAPEVETKRSPELVNTHTDKDKNRTAGPQDQRVVRNSRPTSPQYGTSSPSSSSAQERGNTVAQRRSRDGPASASGEKDRPVVPVAPGQFYYQRDGKYVLLKNPALAAKHLVDEFGKPLRMYAVVSRQRASHPTRFNHHDACHSSRRTRSPANNHPAGQRRKLISVQAWESLPLTEPRSPLGPPRINPYCEVCVARYNLILVDENMNPIQPVSAVTSRGTSPGKLAENRSATPTSRTGANSAAKQRTPQRQPTPEVRRRKILLSDGNTYLMLPYSVTPDSQRPPSRGKFSSQKVENAEQQREGAQHGRVYSSKDDINTVPDVSLLPPPPPVFLETRHKTENRLDSPAEPLVFSDTRGKVGVLDVETLRACDRDVRHKLVSRKSASPPLRQDILPSSKHDEVQLSNNHQTRGLVVTPTGRVTFPTADIDSDANAMRESRRMAERKEKKRQLAIIARQLLADYAAEQKVHDQKGDSPVELDNRGRRRRMREYGASETIGTEPTPLQSISAQMQARYPSDRVASVGVNSRSVHELVNPPVQPHPSNPESTIAQSTTFNENTGKDSKNTKFNSTLERAVKMRMKNLLWHELPLRRDQNQWDEYFDSLNDGLNALKALKVAHMSNRS